MKISDEPASTVDEGDSTLANPLVTSVSAAAPEISVSLAEARKLEEGAAKVNMYMTKLGKEVLYNGQRSLALSIYTLLYVS